MSAARRTSSMLSREIRPTSNSVQYFKSSIRYPVNANRADVAARFLGALRKHLGKYPTFVKSSNLRRQYHRHHSFVSGWQELVYDFDVVKYLARNCQY